jgi:uncharacterized protein YgbK (DUF1537 family)
MKPDVLCLTTDSRNVLEETSRERMRRVLSWASPRDFHHLKKIDSLLRGNVAVEVEEFLLSDVCLSKSAMFAPALPSQGRTTIEGLQLDRGVPVSRSEAATDPLAPAAESSLWNLVPEGREATHLGLEAIRSEDFETDIVSRIEETPVVFLSDAETDTDLAKVFDVAIANHMCLVGSSGLAPHAGDADDAVDVTSEDLEGDILIVTASVRSNVANQLEALSLAHPSIDSFTVTALDDVAVEPLATEVRGSLVESGAAILKAASLPVSPDVTVRREVAQKIIENLCSVAVGVAKSTDRSLTVVLLGGDVSQEFLRQGGVKALRVVGSACQGGAVCLPEGSDIPRLSALVIRSGGFGDSDALLELVANRENVLVRDGVQS